MDAEGRVTYEPLPLPDDQARARALAFLGHLRKRHSVRDFAAVPVPEEIVAACIAAAGTAPSGANRQPWHFVAVSDPSVKTRIRAAAEDEERAFYAGGGGDEWLTALEPIGTGVSKPHRTDAPWLIVASRSATALRRTAAAARTTMFPKASASPPAS